MKQFWTWLAGKKTYLVAAGTAFYALFNWYVGPRDATADHALLTVLQVSGVGAALRHGLTSAVGAPAASLIASGIASSFEPFLTSIQAAIKPAPPIIQAIALDLKSLHDHALAVIAAGADPAAVTSITAQAVGTAAILQLKTAATADNPAS